MEMPELDSPLWDDAKSISINRNYTNLVATMHSDKYTQICTSLDRFLVIVLMLANTHKTIIVPLHTSFCLLLTTNSHLSRP